MGAVIFTPFVGAVACDRCEQTMTVGTIIGREDDELHAILLCPRCLAEAIDTGTGWKYRKQVEYAESFARYPILTGHVTNSRERKRRRVIRRADGSVDLDATMAARRPTAPAPDTVP